MKQRIMMLIVIITIWGRICFDFKIDDYFSYKFMIRFLTLKKIYFIDINLAMDIII